MITLQVLMCGNGGLCANVNTRMLFTLRTRSDVASAHAPSKRICRVSRLKTNVELVFEV
jgi:hypothetical protein